MYHQNKIKQDLYIPIFIKVLFTKPRFGSSPIMNEERGHVIHSSWNINYSATRKDKILNFLHG